MKIIRLEEIDSTNLYINKVKETNIIVTTQFQTSGKGMGINTWESERGKNLLFSMKISPSWLPASDYFLLSMTGALALKATLNEYTEDITLKWPNDIYWKDKKISGTLIQTSISGRFVQDCIYGVGLNINQDIFVSDAPNPVSLKQILGHEVDCEEVLQKFIKHFECYINMLQDDGADSIAPLYHEALYRRDGFHLYEDEDGEFEAKIKEVKHNGHIVLTDTDGVNWEYELKELKFII